jgi:hypothetical protein
MAISSPQLIINKMYFCDVAENKVKTLNAPSQEDKKLQIFMQ